MIPEGYLLPGDDTWLGEIADTIPENGTILEIGTYLGRSSTLLALGSKDSVKIFTIDNKDRAVELNPKIIKIIEDSITVKWDKSVDMLWIDGNHRDKFIRNDIIKFSPFVKKHGLMCGHDYVTKAEDNNVIEVVDELVKNNPDWEDYRIESTHIWAVRKK